MRIEGWNGEIGGARWWARLLTFAAFAGALLGFFGPFGSYLNGSLLVLVLHWTLMSMFGAVVCGLTLPFMVRWLARHGFPLWFALLISLVIIAMPLSVVTATEARWIWPWQVALLRAPDWYVQTLLPSLITVSGWLLIEYARGVRTRPAPIERPAQAALAGPVLCLQMEDHYVRVHRPNGSTLELLPLQDAIARFGKGGLQVHRSWWVAADAVVDAERRPQLAAAPEQRADRTGRAQPHRSRAPAKPDRHRELNVDRLFILRHTMSRGFGDAT